MTTQWSRDAWPNKQYPGDPEGFETYETDKDAWLVVNNFADHINSRPPASLPRVLARYTVADNVHDDPHGPAGTVVPTESGAAYARRCVADTAIGNWHTMLGTSNHWLLCECKSYCSDSYQAQCQTTIHHDQARLWRPNVKAVVESGQDFPRQTQRPNAYQDLQHRLGGWCSHLKGQRNGTSRHIPR